MPSRRELIQLSEEETRDYLDSKKTLIIVSNGKDGFPHPMPMWFYRDEAANLYCTPFRKSQKVLNFQRDPKAALLIESGVDYAELKSVLIYANVDVIDDFDFVEMAQSEIDGFAPESVEPEPWLIQVSAVESHELIARPGVDESGASFSIVERVELDIPERPQIHEFFLPGIPAAAVLCLA